MFWRIARFELQSRLRRPSTHGYFLLFFGIGFLLVNILGEAFGANVLHPERWVNGISIVAGMIAFLSIGGVIFMASFMGETLYRDYEHEMDPLLHTMPVSQQVMLSARFTGAMAACLYVLFGFIFAYALGEIMPWLEPSRFGPFPVGGYAQGIFLYLIPNTVLAGAVFFALTAATRSLQPAYMGSLLLLVGYFLASNYLVAGGPLGEHWMAALFDPFGMQATQQLTQYRTVIESNTQLVPMGRLLIANRLLWAGIGIAVVVGIAVRARWSGMLFASSKATLSDNEVPFLAQPVSSLIRRVALPAIEPVYTFTSRFRQFWALTRQSFRDVLHDRYFYSTFAMVFAALLLVAFQGGTVADTPVEPVTRIIVDEVGLMAFFFSLVLIPWAAGELMWREREQQTDALLDVLPVPSSLRLVAKFGALLGVGLILMTLATAAGITFQVLQGFTDIDAGLYLADFFGVRMVAFMLFSALGLTIHAIVNQKYAANLVFAVTAVGLLLAVIQLPISSPFIGFGLSNIQVPYSDFDGYGHHLARFTWMGLHWAGVAGGMLMAAYLCWPRGAEHTLGARMRRLRERSTRSVQMGALGLGVFVLGTGSFISHHYYTLRGDQYSSEARVALQAEYEQQFGHLANAPHPRVVAIDLEVNLFPAQREATLQSRYTLVNRASRSIDSLLVHIPSDPAVQHSLVSFDRSAMQADGFEPLGFRIYTLDAPLAPGDTLHMDAEVTFAPRSIFNPFSALAKNGTTLGPSHLPQIGYQPAVELTDESDRRDHDMPEKPLMPPRSDTTAQQHMYISRYGDWIDFKATVRTAADQIPLAPGAVDSTWTEGDRQVTRFVSEAPMVPFVVIQSARYATATRTWIPPDTLDHAPVEITIYHHPDHDYNLDRMMDGAQRALDYYTAHFGSYPHSYLRVAEVPQYFGQAAQAFQGTVRFSEDFGFVLRVDEDDNTDFPFYVTAHETAHQWWAHQVVSAGVEGAEFLTETLAQYSTLMVAKARYGEDNVRRFLEHELDRYLTGRTNEPRREHPLVDATSGQNYVVYRKGSNVMYALQDFIGEAQVNAAMRDFFDAHRFAGPPFPTADDLLQRLEAATPDSLQYFIDDQFRDVVLYENSATEARYRPTEAGTYEVTLSLRPKKTRITDAGERVEVPMNDWVDIGIFAEADDGASLGEPLYLQKHQFTGKVQTITLVVDKVPARAGIDPYIKLVDRTPEENMVDVSASAEDDARGLFGAAQHD